MGRGKVRERAIRFKESLMNANDKFMSRGVIDFIQEVSVLDIDELGEDIGEGHEAEARCRADEPTREERMQHRVTHVP